jgi:hypothetical protein
LFTFTLVSWSLVVNSLTNLHGSLIDIVFGTVHGIDIFSVQSSFSFVERGEDFVLSGLVQFVLVFIEGLSGFVEGIVKFILGINSSLDKLE